MKVDAGIFSRSVAGTDGDGVITLVIAGIVGLIAVVALLKSPIKAAPAVIVILGGLVAGGVAIYDIINVNDKINEVTSRTSLVTASVGIGLYLCVAGAALIIVGGFLVGKAPATAAAFAGTRPCPFCAEQIQPAATVCRFCGREVEPVAPRVKGWYPDPSGRYQDRWWDRSAWTEWVRDGPLANRKKDRQPWTPAT